MTQKKFSECSMSFVFFVNKFPNFKFFIEFLASEVIFQTKSLNFQNKLLNFTKFQHLLFIFIFINLHLNFLAFSSSDP
jgi:hypothetical protein